MSKSKKAETPQDDFLADMNQPVENLTSQEAEISDPAKDEFETLANEDEDENEFETENELTQEGLDFFNPETDGTLKAVWLGMGPNVKTVKQPEGFNTYALFDIKRKRFVLITANKSLEKIHEKYSHENAGKYLVEITATGKKESQAGREYNTYDVKSGPLKKPFTDFDLAEIQKMR